MIEKGDSFRTMYSGKIYQVVGKWESNIVLAPVNKEDEQCLIYTPSEIEELLEQREFVREES